MDEADPRATLERDAPGFAQRGSAKLSADGSTLAGVWQLNEGDQGYRDDLALTYRRASGGDGLRAMTEEYWIAWKGRDDSRRPPESGRNSMSGWRWTRA